MRTLAPLLLALTCLGAPALADEIKLKNGATLRGTVLSEKGGMVTIKLDGGGKTKIPRKQIAEIKGGSQPHKPRTPDPKGGSATSTKAESVDLRYQFAEGSKTHYRNVTRSTTTLRGQDKVVKRTSTRTSEFTVEVRKVGAKSKAMRLRLTITRLTSKSTQDGNTIEDKDTRRDRDWQQGAALTRPMEFVLSAKGKIETLLVFGGTALQSVPPERRPQLEKVARSLLNGTLFVYLGEFPAGKSKPGATWSAVDVIPIPGVGEATMTVQNKLLTITGQDSRVNQSGSAKLASQAVELTSSSIKGAVVFDHARGLLESSRFSYELNLKGPVGSVQSKTTSHTKLTP